MGEIVDYAVNELGFISKPNPIMFGVAEYWYKKEINPTSYLRLDGRYMELVKIINNTELSEPVAGPIESIEELKNIVNKYKQCK